MQRVTVAIEAAKAAGAALRVAHDHDLKVEEKNASRTSIVTSADLQSHDIIFGIIRRAFPDDAIFGEEGNDGDERAAARWYVDPLDGTTNFSHRFPFSCISIAYCDGDDISLGVVYDPYRDDLFIATRGGGAFRNGEQLAVSAGPERRRPERRHASRVRSPIRCRSACRSCARSARWWSTAPAACRQ